MTEALLGLGGNVGEVRATIDHAIGALCDGDAVRLVARSSNYETPPWGMAEQPAFVNACIAVETNLSPHALLDRALAVERTLGRDRAGAPRWGPRTIDIDLLTYDELSLEEPGLVLPHPRIFERAFVLVPLGEIRPDLVIGGVSLAAALARTDASGIVRLD